MMKNKMLFLHISLINANKYMYKPVAINFPAKIRFICGSIFFCIFLFSCKKTTTTALTTNTFVKTI